MLPDPLTALRDFCINSKPIKTTNDKGEPVSTKDYTFFLFDNYIISRKTLTSLKNKRQEYYPLDAVYFCYLNKDTPSYSSYLQECKQWDILNISMLDKKEVLEFLQGKIETTKTVEIGTVQDYAWIDMNDVEEQEKKRIKLAQESEKATIWDVIGYERNLKDPEMYFKDKRDFSSVLLTLKQVTRMEANAEVRHSVQQDSSSDINKIPIIIVPATVTCLLNLYNVKEFLENEKFVPCQEIKKNSAKESKVVIQRKKGNRTLSYLVLDSISKLKPQDWDRVVAVFAQGPAWQFKGWKWDSPVQIFANVHGFHLAFDDTKVESTILSWNVKVLSISKNKRHLDATAVFQFWESLDRFISQNKPSLNYF